MELCDVRSLSELVCVRSQCLSKVVLVLLHSPDAMCEAFPIWVLKVSSLSPIAHVEHDNASVVKLKVQRQRQV